jgi:hypothetical protein
MIRVTMGTVYITAEALCDRYNFARLSARFSYATGNLRQAALVDADARELRAFAATLAESKRVRLERIRLQFMPDGGEMFDYVATKISLAPAMYPDAPTTHEKISEVLNP